MHLVIATHNPAKAREFREMLAGSDIDFSDLTEHPQVPPVAETGSTFYENACLKAAAYARGLNSWALADDSGLEVDALGGKPGVHSARWAELNDAGSGDAANNALLLRRLAGVPDHQRTARFICVLALANPQGRIVHTAAGSVDGVILHQPRGGGGFGYDPLFLIPALGQTTAELSPHQKHQVSHRGHALRQMRELLKTL